MTTKFKEVFPQKNSLLAVVHSYDLEQTITNVKIAVDNQLHGVFLINHSMCGRDLLHIFRETRRRFGDTWLGINLLDYTITETIQAVGQLEKEGHRVDGIWTDNPEIHGINPGHNNQDAIAKVIDDIGWKGLYFGGVFFKHQRQPDDISIACEAGKKYLDVITTSGPATGKPADIKKVEKIRKHSGKHPVALASGVSHHNIHEFSGLVDAFIVASSLNRESDFLNFDTKKVKTMSTILRELNS